MRYIHFDGGKAIHVAEKPLPVPGKGEVLVKILRCALCGSDFKLYHNGQNVIGGHEPMGRVEQPGHPLDGKRCLLYMPEYCGECADCRRGDTHLCFTAPLIGWNRDGAYAEYAAVPEKCLIPVPDDIPDDLACMMLDAVATPAHGIDLAEMVLPDRKGRVLIFGAGIIGLGGLLVCRDRGYTDITVSEPRENRQARARRLGATIRPGGDMDERYDLVLECSGNVSARQEAIEVVAPRGAVVLLGESEAPWTLVENKIIRRKDFYMIRSFYFPRDDIMRNADVLRRNLNEYASLADEVIGLDDFAEGFARFAAGETTKPMFCPGE